MNNDAYDYLPVDTPPEIIWQQAAIIRSLPCNERRRVMSELSDFCYQQTMNFLKKKLQTTDEKLLKIAFIETVYKDDFSAEEHQRIKEFFMKS